MSMSCIASVGALDWIATDTDERHLETTGTESIDKIETEWSRTSAKQSEAVVKKKQWPEGVVAVSSTQGEKTGTDQR